MVVIAVLLYMVFWSSDNQLAEYSAMHEGKAILYATSWCGYCKKMRQFLKKNNIAYYEYDIENSSEGNKQYQSLGARGVPVMLIDGEVVHGYNPQKVLQLANKSL